MKKPDDFKCPLCDFVPSNEPANEQEIEIDDGDMDIRIKRLRIHMYSSHSLPRKENGGYVPRLRL